VAFEVEEEIFEQMVWAICSSSPGKIGKAKNLLKFGISLAL